MASPKRKVFLSFHYALDHKRALQVRDATSHLVDFGEWESIRKYDDELAIWIDKRIAETSCTIVLIGRETVNREWIHYEIENSWNKGNGVTGIYLPEVGNSSNLQLDKCRNPFRHIRLLKDDVILSNFVEPHHIASRSDREFLNALSDNIVRWIDDAILTRNRYISYHVSSLGTPIPSRF